MNNKDALKKKVDRFHSESLLRKRKFCTRFTSEGLWDRIQRTLALAHRGGIYFSRLPVVDTLQVARLVSIGGNILTIVISRYRPKDMKPISPDKIFSILVSGEANRSGTLVCYLPRQSRYNEELKTACCIMGSRGGRSTSKRKQEAARRNGKLGGRPVKKKRKLMEKNREKG